MHMVRQVGADAAIEYIVYYILWQTVRDIRFDRAEDVKLYSWSAGSLYSMQMTLLKAEIAV